jgi:hypothetical protein
MDSLNVFIKGACIPTDLSQRMRSYVRFRRYTEDVHLRHDMLRLLSPSLSAEVALHLNAEWMAKVPYFGGCSEMMAVKLAFVLRSESYPPEECFIAADAAVTKLCLIAKGIVTAKGKVLTAGMVVGEEMLVGRAVDRVAGYTARTMTYVDVVVLVREDLDNTLAEFPEAGRGRCHVKPCGNPCGKRWKMKYEATAVQ